VTIGPDHSWTELAGCSSPQEGEADWFWEQTAKGRYLYEAEAKGVCASCDFVDRCLDTALFYPEGGGIWGRTTHQERRDIRAGLQETHDLFIKTIAPSVKECTELVFEEEVRRLQGILSKGAHVYY